ncbi:hypothetical protein Bca52824_040260 [Brassica carinata]|uniref:NYN domain-containing protein n=1 Tax=Brassica carinata TaxID=52824 RepID=A0A8X7RSQ8_BRACI|nr:hypothetical protein Bca52824_040260 [Brassica carinata]
MCPEIINAYGIKAAQFAMKHCGRYTAFTFTEKTVLRERTCKTVRFGGLGCWSDPTEFRRAFKEKGYSGLVSITAYGDQTQTPGHILQGLFSTGISVAHTISESTCNLMYRIWWNGEIKILLRYNDDHIKSGQYLVLSSPQVKSGWKELLQNKRLIACCCSGPSCIEGVTTVYTNVERVTADWGRNYKATPEFATAKIQVWWDMFDCPIPQGYDARQVPPSIEAAFKELGYSGPVSITAYGDHKHTPLQALSSTGVHVAHAVPGVEYKRMAGDVREWHADNPPQTAAIIMVISDNVDIISIGLVKLLQENKYNLFLAYSFRPYQMSYLLTSAEWLWESLLAGPLTKHSLLSESESSEAELEQLEKSVEPSWPKLVEPLEKLVDRLSVVWGVINHLKAVKDTPELRAALIEMYNICGQRFLSADAFSAFEDARLDDIKMLLWCYMMSLCHIPCSKIAAAYAGHFSTDDAKSV